MHTKRMLLVAAIVTGLLGITVGPAGATTGLGVDPVLVDGNPTCIDLGWENDFKIDPVPAGDNSFPVNVNGVDGVVTILNKAPDNSPGGNTFDFESTIPVLAVFVKAGPGGNLYVYDDDPPEPWSPGPGATFADTGLISPATDSISHINFCFGEGALVFEDLTISKTAVPHKTLEYDWEIAKEVAEPTTVEISGDGTATFDYTVEATKLEPPAEHSFYVDGVITIDNPNAFDVDLVGVVDEMVGGDCEVFDVPASIDADSELNLDYRCDFEDPQSGETENSATVTWVDPALEFDPDATAIAPVDWDDAVIDDVINDEVTVEDEFDGLAPEVLGTIDETTTFEYSREIAVPDAGCVDFDNTATIVETGAEAGASVTVCRLTSDGFTIGFWQNKNGQTRIFDDRADLCASLFSSYPNLLGSEPTDCTGGSGPTRPNDRPPFGNLGKSVFDTIKAAESSGDGVAMLKAQFLATALSVHFSEDGLGDTGVVVDPAIVGTDCITVNDLLAWTDANLASFEDDKDIVTTVKDYFDSINNNTMLTCAP